MVLPTQTCCQFIWIQRAIAFWKNETVTRLVPSYLRLLNQRCLDGERARQHECGPIDIWDDVCISTHHA